MAWEMRRRGTRYYTRSRKVGGRVLREHVGGGVVGELAAKDDQRRRAQHAAARAAWHAEREHLEAAERALNMYCWATEHLMRTELTAAGYHQHARGAWRRRRDR